MTVAYIANKDIVIKINNYKKHMNKITKSSSITISLSFVLMMATSIADELHTSPFVSLTDINKSIVVEMRYFGKHNFIGRQIKGYEKNACMLVEKAALALSLVQKELAKKSLSLKIYDCYRPQMAVTDFMTWAKKSNHEEMKVEFYPNVYKNKLIKKGYIASRSGHSRGDSIDLTIIKLPVEEQPLFNVDIQKDCTAPVKARYQDNSLDMGTGYDCFDILSHTMNKKIAGAPHKNRLLLKKAMEKYGFRNYKKEWWHFTYVKPYGKKQFYNFPIK